MLGTMAADLFCNRWEFEVLPDCLVRHIPRCIRYYSQSLWLEAFENFFVRRRCGAPELMAVRLPALRTAPPPEIPDIYFC
jgi:hypothetical protein